MTTAPRSPRLLLLSTVLFAVAGSVLLGLPHHHKPPSPAPASLGVPAASPAGAAAPAGEPSTGTAPPATATAAASPAARTSAAAGASALPLHGEGPAGDRAVQLSLEAAWPADLPASDARQLLAAGRALLRADATGVGRAQWPAVFGGSKAAAPAFAAGRFRIQAAIARRHGSPDTAVVHLVWAGTDRGGTFTDLRITDWFFTRTIKKGTAAWTPQLST